MKPILSILALLPLACGGGHGNTTGDGDGDGDTDSGGDDAASAYRVCASGDAPYGSIGEAVAGAPDGSTIDVCAGTYAESLDLSGRTLTIRGYGGDVIVDAGGAAGVVTATAGAQVALRALILRNGAAREGGGILCEASTVSLTQVAVDANVADDNGGGLHATDCTLHLTGSAITNNSADDGGGLHLTEGTATIEDSVISGNAANFRAGGLYQLHGDLTVSGSHFSENTSQNDGAGMYLDESDALFTDNEITNNTSAEDAGGARVFTSHARFVGNHIWANHAADGGGGMKISHLDSDLRDNVITDNVAATGGGLELDNDTSRIHGGEISNNQATRGGGIHASLWGRNGGLFEDIRMENNQADIGGALYLEESYTPVTLRRLTVVGNHARIGGGIAIRRTEFTLHNALFSGNQADEQGGGLLIGNADRELLVTTCTMFCPATAATGAIDFLVAHGNQAPAGGGLWLKSPQLAVSDSIVTGNGDDAVRIAGTTPQWHYTTVWPAAFDGMTDPTGSGGNLADNPLFLDAAAGDFHLGAGSPCIDAGDPSLADRDTSRADMGLFGGPEAP
ncbi:MAG TPA: right-handed parallel beta-helix repeat-containing protein [Kofleriaceae bacterium]|nr:right-handed parallel beta-helix repeat-containing protein [Kofleriaceae bacterium]